MIYLFIAIFVLLLAFGGVILRGAPYVPTLDPQARAALELLDLKTGPECDGVFSFLLGRFMPRLDQRMQTLKKPLASFAFKIPDRTIAAEKAGVFLYKY
jgi:hypothetical protein